MRCKVSQMPRHRTPSRAGSRAYPLRSWRSAVWTIATLGAAADRVRQAGATTPATIWLEPTWALSDPAARARLQAIVGGPIRTPAQLRAAGLALLARRLAHPPATGDASAAKDALQKLVDAGFVTVQAADGTDASSLDGWPGSGGRVLGHRRRRPEHAWTAGNGRLGDCASAVSFAERGG